MLKKYAVQMTNKEKYATPSVKSTLSGPMMFPLLVITSKAYQLAALLILLLTTNALEWNSTTNINSLVTPTSTDGNTSTTLPKLSY
jgi:hypothetical protein